VCYRGKGDKREDLGNGSTLAGSRGRAPVGYGGEDAGSQKQPSKMRLKMGENAQTEMLVYFNNAFNQTTKYSRNYKI